MLCLYIGTHSGKTCVWLFRKAGKSSHLSICKWAGEDKISVMKFLAWGHQMITYGVRGKNLAPTAVWRAQSRCWHVTGVLGLSLKHKVLPRGGIQLCRGFSRPSCIQPLLLKQPRQSRHSGCYQNLPFGLPELAKGTQGSPLCLQCCCSPQLSLAAFPFAFGFGAKWHQHLVAVSSPSPEVKP